MNPLSYLPRLCAARVRRQVALGAAISTCALAAASALPAAAAAATRIDLNVLLLGTSTTEPGFQAWQAELQREGVKFTTLIASAGHTPITAATLSSTLSNGTLEGKYEAIIVPVGGMVDCSSGTCQSDLSSAEWSALEAYEHQFNVRQISGDVYPGASYGLTAPTTSGALDGVTGTLTAHGKTVFPYLNGPVKMDVGTYGYTGDAVAAGANFDTLVTAPGGSPLVGVYTDANGVQQLVETFNGNQYQLQSELLRHGALAWATRGVYFGDQRNYLETNIDDTFLPDDRWDPSTHTTNYDPAAALREAPGDVTYAGSWSGQNKFRIDDLFNGGGSQAAADATTDGNDPLLAAFQATDRATGKPYANDFGWINHTWDHPNLDQGCATQTYIQNEITQNTQWATKGIGDAYGDPSVSGLGLSSVVNSTTPLGTVDPGAVVTGEHSGLANLLPGNPGVVDPPSFDDVTVDNGGTLPAGTYVWAVTDQFSPTGGQSTASETQQTLTSPGEVTLSWPAVCHAADYKVYREVAGTNNWRLLATIKAPTTNPPNTSFDNTGPLDQSFDDDNSVAGTASAPPPTVNNAVESAYEQNVFLPAAFSGLKITAFGADASKPYPNPATAVFSPGGYAGATFAAGATFTDGGGQAVPRYPTNIYYNVSTEQQEVDEYNHLYLPPPAGVCVNSSTTTCLSSPATFAQIIASVDQGMFQHLMGNDPRPDYFHQTNMMGRPPAGAPTAAPPNTSPSVGDGLYYSTMNGLLASYNQYFNVPLQQPTMGQIATLLGEQAAWATNTAVTGYIQHGQITVTNSGSTAVNVPLTGAGIGSAYGGSTSGWTQVVAGTKTFTSPTIWPGT